LIYLKIVLITGFLGSGKTTFLSELLEFMNLNKVGVIMNEFGKLGIDGTIVSSDNLNMIELNNGSIFCACIKDNFLKALIEMSNKKLDYVVVEASGLADPSNISQIIEAVNSRIDIEYEYIGSVCIVDAMYFFEYLELLPSIERQIKYSGMVIINKIDLKSDEEINKISERIKNINPMTDISKASYCKLDIEDLFKKLQSPQKKYEDTTNTVENRPKTISINSKEILDHEGLLKLLELTSPYTYRIKGFVNTDKGTYVVSCVNSIISVNPWDKKEELSRLVFISSVGIKLISEISNNWKKCLTASYVME
jgi:G3E family GTPase